MAAVSTKFSINDVCYTFDSKAGVIYRSIVHAIKVDYKNLGDVEVMYQLANTTPDPSTGTTAVRVPTAAEYEQNLLTEAEVKDLANTWLINKSLSIFQNAGL